MLAAPLVIRASSLPGYLDCQLRAAANSQGRLFAEHGHELRRGHGNIGAVVGSGVHAGAEFALSDRMMGRLSSLSACEDAAIEALRQRIEDEAGEGLIFDEESPSQDKAERATRRMVAVYREDVAVIAAPVAVESRIEAEFAPGVILSGQSDLLHLDLASGGHRVRDLKTGRRHQPAAKHAAQVGAYSLLFRSRGHTTDGAQIDFLKRVRPDREQPRVLEEPLPIEGCERQAYAVLAEFSTKLRAFAADGDPGRFLPNATSLLCNSRFCRLHGQPACPATYGGSV